MNMSLLFSFLRNEANETASTEQNEVTFRNNRMGGSQVPELSWAQPIPITTSVGNPNRRATRC
jgi:hypothetical protein